MDLGTGPRDWFRKTRDGFKLDRFFSPLFDLCLLPLADLSSNTEPESLSADTNSVLWPEISGWKLPEDVTPKYASLVCGYFNLKAMESQQTQSSLSSPHCLRVEYELPLSWERITFIKEISICEGVSGPERELLPETALIIWVLIHISGWYFFIIHDLSPPSKTQNPFSFA